MVYVHRLMGDGAPGEADPKALSSASQSIYSKVVSDAERFAGPYKVKATLPDKLVAGQAAELTVEVLTLERAARPERGRQPLRDRRRRAPGLGQHRLQRRRQGADHRHRPRGRDQAHRDRGLAARRAADAVRRPPRASRCATRSGSSRRRSPSRARSSRRRSAPSRRWRPRSAAVRGAGLGDHGHGQGHRASPARPRRSRPRSTGRTPRATRSSARTRRSGPARSQATGDGDYVTAPVKLDTPGYYTYRESIAESDTIAGVQTACAEASETTIIRGAPSITTQVSAQETAPGAQITDAAVVTGLGKLSATVNVELWGPFPTRAAITCEGTPFWTGTFPAAGDGTYTTAPVTLTVGRLLHLPRVDRRHRGLRRGRHQLRRGVGDDDRQGRAAGHDRRLGRRGPPGRAALRHAQRHRPGQDARRRSRSSSTAPTPHARTSTARARRTGRAPSTATGDGTYSSPKATVRRVGFYVFREKIAATETVAGHQAECQVEAETSLAAPSILGGRGDDVAYVAQGARRAVEGVKLARLGIDAPVSAIGIDMKSGALGIPENIKRVGWWRDGATPGDEAGTALIARPRRQREGRRGRVLRAQERPPRRRRHGHAGRKTLRYRVTDDQDDAEGRAPDEHLHAHRLAEARPGDLRRPIRRQDGHYRDNIVVTAVPA